MPAFCHPVDGAIARVQRTSKRCSSSVEHHEMPLAGDHLMGLAKREGHDVLRRGRRQSLPDFELVVALATPGSQADDSRG